MKNGCNVFHVTRDILQKPAKRSYVDFLENCICGDKNISDFEYGGDNLSHPYTHVFGKIFVAASVICGKLQLVCVRSKVRWVILLCLGN